MYIRIDFQKAFDRLDWNFIVDTLQEAKFPPRTSSIQIQWNGQLCMPSSPTRGIRQRNPISPYLFVMSHMISVNNVNEPTFTLFVTSETSCNKKLIIFFLICYLCFILLLIFILANNNFMSHMVTLATLCIWSSPTFERVFSTRSVKFFVLRPPVLFIILMLNWVLLQGFSARDEPSNLATEDHARLIRKILDFLAVFLETRNGNTELFWSDMVLPSGDWNWDFLHQRLQPSAVLHFLSILPPAPSFGEDRCSWAASPNHIYSTKSAYQALMKPQWNVHNKNGLIPWKAAVPKRIRDWCTMEQAVLVFYLANMKENELIIPQDNQVDLIWRAPPHGWVALNTDGAVSSSSSLDATGGLIRDCHGTCLGGFIRPLGVTTALQAELWGLFEGLKHAWNKDRAWLVDFKLFNTEANKAAYALAKLCLPQLLRGFFEDHPCLSF
ncbi:hypothetical protein F3Y22_tig00111069pilonHSYRG00117 [Hibiscus syriacus]|uniref:RNase H type-1 domain-containing protein n=1 Tax=Hibiscus syriacus TaxID=106335 RepID=A0A6A2Z322_HIBSY|nr:hypothetical protein F3Y22_tig00111069pilonHSYRG00117 [Hibiscus syriacus]